MPWSIASRYVIEFGRVIHNGGWVVFQIPTGESAGTTASRLRRRLVDLLPGSLAATYRRWRHGTSAVFDMHFTPAAEVERVAGEAGLKLLTRVPDESAGRGSEGFLFVFRKESSSR
jgi:siroheme synthase (precorrin-2 oxidase/ferrochelatase)